MDKVGIIGGTGYTGSELSRMLCTHPEVELAALTSRQNAGKKVSELQTFLKGYSDIRFTEKISDTKDLDLVFVATPHGVAMDEVPQLMESGVKVIDLSGDYRLRDKAEYAKWYGHEQTDAKNLKSSVYGLPEFFRSKIKNADLVANPGCYATSIILACTPLVKAGVVETDIIADAKSGTSGAGMVPSARLHHPFCGESLIPYSVGTHRHTPEIEQTIGDITKGGVKVTMVPQLLPIVRGILSSCYMNLKKDMSDEEIAKIFEKQYGEEHFVHYVKEPSIRAVVGSNHAHVGSNVIGNKVVAFGVLDNLVKGASGQAVQCMNLMLGIKETTGIDTPGLGV
ncbi:N-acetyl-gamma-glutamyl-phosphate reductase [Candidatus Methanoplasma termitum]|uniref:N-acetyl-gamma-glutamyl-phosphate reductase n=1 Tax=Candidatus Methanoplasma termitum TaxID=1577791 RepID=A0A0A7LB41_9ARCH|nr:N-acetyl-gamma-glutamyl-phosphate reductase [Candidatus Methanoplasma termitum]AIZ56218.1 N-acetyl-gamma-glutamyl-phosphate reductase [Candidatus Methanoplasma termitum]